MKIIFTLILALSISFCFSQFTLTDNNGQTITGESGSLYLGSYTPGEVYTVTLCSDNPMSSHISMNFSYWEPVDGNFCVYDGNSTAAPLISCNAWDVGQPVAASQSNPTGCLTFQFTSPTVGSNIGGVYSSNFMCQELSVEITSTTPAYELMSGNKIINSCGPVDVQFHATATYSNITYPQSDANSTYRWIVSGEEVGTGPDLNYSFTELGIKKVTAMITDIEGCSDYSDSAVFVRIPTAPNIEISPENYSVFLTGDSITLSANAYYDLENPACQTNFVSGEIGVLGASSQYSISYDFFDPGRTLDDINDLVGICTNMEHSYLGDLIFTITCPYNTLTGSPTTVILQQQSGGSAFLGEPIFSDGTGPGVGYDYCWTIPAYADNQGTFTDFAASNTVIPPGSYTTAQPLDALVGCELNGEWTLTITDNWSIDDGYLFCFGMSFSEDLFSIPHAVNFNIDSINWIGENIVSDNGTDVIIVPETEGTYIYQCIAYNNIGCENNYNLFINVVDTPSFAKGKVFFDLNMNCDDDMGEEGLSGRIIEITPGPIYTSTNELGEFETMTGSGDYTFKLVTNTSDSIACFPDFSQDVFIPLNDTVENILFPKYIYPVVDYKIDFSHNRIRPGFVHQIGFHGRNVGNITIPHVQLVLKIDPIQEYDHANITPDIVSEDSLVWNLYNLLPGSYDYFFVYFYVSPDIPLGFGFTNEVIATTSIPDSIPENNYEIHSLFTQGSYDPNEKEVFPENEILPTQEYLDYTIYFQNTGTDTAFNVFIIDTLSQNLDIATFEPGAASHNYTWELSGPGIVRFNFNDILLVDSLHNEPMSHGFVSYKINPKEDLVIGDVIENTAYIFFDFNLPVVTNTTVNNVVDSIVYASEVLLPDVRIYPNPVTDILKIDTDKKITYTIYNYLGEVLLMGENTNINVEQLSSGVFLIQLRFEDGTALTRRFIKK